MGGSLRQLTSRQLERLKSELAEVIIANFCYPAFLDYRLNALRMRPVDRRKRQEVWSYVSGVNFHPLEGMEATSMDFRRFVERIFLRYIDLNRALMSKASARQVAAVRARVPQLAASVARGLADYLVLSEASTFGQARLIESWGANRSGLSEPTWEQIEKSTQVLQTTLVYLRAANAEKAAGDSGGLSERPSFPDISAFPTRLLAPLDPELRLAAAGATNGTSPAAYDDPALHHGSSNGMPNGAEASQLPPVLLGDDPGAQGQFRGPRRSPTASRPVERPITHPVQPFGDAPVAPPGTISRPIQPSSVSDVPGEVRGTISRPIQPSPVGGVPGVPGGTPSRPIQPSPVGGVPGVPGGTPSRPIPPTILEGMPGEPRGGSSRPLQPPQPAPMHPQPDDSPDIWQELLMRGDAEPPAAQPPEPARPALADQPQIEMPDLPESFGGPHLMDLPPDLAELYGDYLRDARSASIDLTPAPDAVSPADARPKPSTVPLPSSETDEEVDALFTALTNHIAAAQKQSGQEAHAQQQAAPPEPEPVDDSSAAPVPPWATSGKPTSAPLSASPEAQRKPSPPVKGVTDGDVMIFSQLQHQISTWVKMAAVSHQIDLAGRDAPELVEELRRMAALEEAELQVIESLVALCYRVTSTKQATMEDYKQAMMLYLLHHRSRLAL
jgi:hypothetical protein